MRRSFVFCFFLFTLVSCTRSNGPKAAFYYWKTTFEVDSAHKNILSSSGGNTLYLRFFDVTWDKRMRSAQPKAVLQPKGPLKGLLITPVIFITNNVFERTPASEIDSLAKKCNDLLFDLTLKAHCSCKGVQIDCDWTDSTKDKYFSFLRSLKAYRGSSLQATIRLHQVKYRERTGVPPVDKGVLMFYNMGKITAGGITNSIYNEKDAAKYLGRLGSYPLQLDVALPLFSWVIQSRNGKVIHIYSKITRSELNNILFFEALENGYRARKSFFLKGVYIKENDIFKPEEISADLLERAARQLSAQLPVLKNRTIIYYELANINLHQFSSETLNKVTYSF